MISGSSERGAPQAQIHVLHFFLRQRVFHVPHFFLRQRVFHMPSDDTSQIGMNLALVFN